MRRAARCRVSPGASLKTVSGAGDTDTPGSVRGSWAQHPQLLSSWEWLRGPETRSASPGQSTGASAVQLRGRDRVFLGQTEARRTSSSREAGPVHLPSLPQTRSVLLFPSALFSLLSLLLFIDPPSSPHPSSPLPSYSHKFSPWGFFIKGLNKQEGRADKSLWSLQTGSRKVPDSGPLPGGAAGDSVNLRQPQAGDLPDPISPQREVRREPGLGVWLCCVTLGEPHPLSEHPRCHL